MCVWGGVCVIKMHSIGSRCVTGPENILFVGASKHLSALKLYRLGQQRGWKEERNWTVAVCYSLDKLLTFFLFALLCYIQTIVSISLDTPLPPLSASPTPKYSYFRGCLFEDCMPCVLTGCPRLQAPWRNNCYQCLIPTPPVWVKRVDASACTLSARPNLTS